MKLSEKIGRKKSSSLHCKTGMILNSADRRLAANAVHGKRQTAIVVPGGMCYIPRPGEDAVMLSDENEQLCIGIKMLQNQFEIQPGELVLFTENGNRIVLKKNGRIELFGDVYINGTKLEVN